MSGAEKGLPQGDVVALHAYRAIYFAIPKVANSSLKAVCADWIKDSLDAKQLDRYWSEKWKPRLFRDQRAREYLRNKRILISRSDLVRLNSYWRFGFVRNPWDRMVSCWRQKIAPEELTDGTYVRGVARSLSATGDFRAGMSLRRFVEVVAEIPDEEANSHYRSQCSFVEDTDGQLLVDYVGRFESLRSDFEYARVQLGAPPTELPHLLKSRGTAAYRDYYDLATRRLVEQRYARDVDLFEYEY